MSPVNASSIELRELLSDTVGWQFAHAGREEGAVDCFGFFLIAMKRLGIDLPDYKVKPLWYKKGYDYFVTEYHKFSRVIPEEEAEPGDAVTFKAPNGIANHIAVYLGDGQVIHCDRHVGGVAVEALDSRRLRSKRRTFYRLFK